MTGTRIEDISTGYEILLTLMLRYDCEYFLFCSGMKICRKFREFPLVAGCTGPVFYGLGQIFLKLQGMGQ